MEYTESIKSNISFCNKQTENITCDNYKKEILNQLYNNYQVSITDKNYIILRKNFLNNLIKNKHYMTLKSFGNDYFLYLTKCNNNNTCFFIDTKIKNGFMYPRIIETKYRFSDELFQNTLFKGELIRTKDKKWLYNIYNILVYKGKKLKNKNIIDKYKILFDIFNNKYVQDTNLEVCLIKIRKIFDYSERQEMDDFIKNISNIYQIKGIIFNPDNYHYNNLLYVFPFKKEYKHSKNAEQTQTKTDNNYIGGIQFSRNNIQKETLNLKEKQDFETKINMKNYKKIVITFKINKTDMPDIFNLSILNLEKTEYLDYGVAHIQTLKTSKLIKNIFKNEQTEIILVDCLYSVNFQKWEPKQLSKNQTANSIEEMKTIINNCKN